MEKTAEITVSVTQEDIKLGEKLNCMDCPIARAVRRAIPSVENVSVYGSFVALVAKGGRGIRVDGTDETERFAESFDNGDPVQPFAFPLSVPASLLDD